MKITRLSVYQKNLPLKDSYWLSGGRLKFEVLDATFIKMETDAGITGWGEGTPWGNACWSCQDMLAEDIAPDSGPRCNNGYITINDTPGLGVEPDEKLPGSPVAVYQ